MLPHIVSLLDSLAQSTFVWNGDIIVNVSGGAVDWLGLCAVLVLWLAVRKR
ncbi:MAG: GlyGly-CTERM sorting domain-containing protein [Sutterella wadsworthensis]|nr:GlyGly-CTERM sorting domain-containing protein [Sutterella wadsworthensis]